MGRARRLSFTIVAVAVGASLAAATPAVAADRERPPTIVDVASSTRELSTLVAAVQRAGFAELLADRSAHLTVFAPTNAAFADLLGQLGLNSIDEIPVETLQGVLLDHVLDHKLKAKQLAALDRKDEYPAAVGGLAIDFDRQPTGVNDASIVAADVLAANGVVHVIDRVLLDPDPRPTITELAVATPDLSILVQAVLRAGLAETLAQLGPYTVFAPTNLAFTALFARLGLPGIDDVPLDMLTAVLLDHVVVGELDAVDVLERADAGRSAQTIGGLRLDFAADPPGVNGAGIVAVDVEGRNGTVHVIDAVLLEPGT
jgi:transforming growth factor-beta-induced protein